MTRNYAVLWFALLSLLCLLLVYAQFVCMKNLPRGTFVSEENDSDNPGADLLTTTALSPYDCKYSLHCSTKLSLFKIIYIEEKEGPQVAVICLPY